MSNIVKGERLMGPFTHTITAPIVEGSKTERSVRYILGAPKKAVQIWPQIEAELAAVPTATFDQAVKGTRAIFERHGIQRVDF